MKNIIFTLTIIIALGCKAQTPIINITSDYQSEDIVNGCYLKDVDNSFAPFLGTWRWTNNTDTLTIVIEKIEMVYNDLGEKYADELVGKYKYVENGVEIINTLNYNINANNAWDVHPNYPKRMLSPMLGACYRNTTIADFSFSDYLKNKGETAKFVLLDLMETLNGTFTATQAKLTLINREHWNIDGQSPRASEFTIPNNIILVKQ